MKNSIRSIRKLLLEHGKVLKTNNWQGTENPPAFLELVQPVMKFDMVDNEEDLNFLTGADQPWAAEHFAERVSGKPLNPPPSHVKWRMKTSDYMVDGKFDHTYPERMWPKGLMTGIRFDIGDLYDVARLLDKDPTTRQAVMPMFTYEDITAGIEGRRVPCSLSWNFIIRDGYMHCTYTMRSCDAVRHMHNDIYFANKLVLWMISNIRHDVKPGKLMMTVSSLHCFENDKPILRKILCAE